MHTVKVARWNLAQGNLADLIHDELGVGYQVKEGPDELKIMKGAYSRTRIVLSHESDGTLFEVQGEGARLPIPFFYATSKRLNDRGIAARSAAIISQSIRLRDILEHPPAWPYPSLSREGAR